MDNLDLAHTWRGRLLDLPPYYLDRLAEALVVDPPYDIARAQHELRARDLTAEHYHLTPGDLRGIKRRKTKE